MKYDASFARINLEALADQAGLHADTAYWNTDMADTQAWAAREDVCRSVIAALRSKASLTQVREMIAASETAPGTSTTVWREVRDLFEVGVSGRFADWPTEYPAPVGTD